MKNILRRLIVIESTGGTVECPPHFAEKRVFSGILQENMIELKRTREIHTRWKLIF